MTSLTSAQLKAALTSEQVLAARTKGVAAADAIDPVDEAISAATAKVDAYAAGYDVPPALLTSWARDLAAHHIASRLGAPTADQVRAFERACKELEDLRDGKFLNASRSPASSTSKVLSGSRPKVI